MGDPIGPSASATRARTAPSVTGLTIKKPDDLYINTDMFEHKYVCRRRDISASSAGAATLSYWNELQKKRIGRTYVAQDAHLQIERLHLRNARPTRYASSRRTAGRDAPSGVDWPSAVHTPAKTVCAGRVGPTPGARGSCAQGGVRLEPRRVETGSHVNGYAID